MLRTAKRGGAWPRATSALLATLLALGLPGAGLDAVASEPPVHQPGRTALSVASEPAGVAVYVDGRPHGQTPVTLSDVGAGEHRLLLVQDGYLANRRVVSVKAGQTGAVHVRMTPAAGGARHGIQQDPGSEGGGGRGGRGKKALLIGLGVAAAGAGAYLLLAGGNDPPVPGTISVSPTGSGMAGVTSFTFTSQGAAADLAGMGPRDGGGDGQGA